MISRITRTLMKRNNANNIRNIEQEFKMSTSCQKIDDNDKSKEDMSVRATKRSRARAHYRKKHNVKEQERPVEDMSLTDYYFENGLRKVYPYYYNFSTYVKARWFGRSMLEVFTKEFPGETEEKYREEIEAGRMTVNGKQVSPSHKLSNGEFLEHRTHRHENPTLATPIEIIADTPEVLVINKPASIPCHPCGRYRFNSITFILVKELGYKNLRTLYRLDRMTSGVLIMPKTKATSSKMEKQLYNRQLQKEYVCRVDGKFPDGPITCNEPLGVLSNTLYMNKVDPRGKESSTTFTRLSYNGKTSVVKCVPHTGRTHQIRVHLQFLGYPIVNDNLYNTPAFGPNRGKGGIIDRSVDQIVEEVRKYHNTGVWKLGPNPLFEKKLQEKQEAKKLSNENLAPCDKMDGDSTDIASDTLDSSYQTTATKKDCDQKAVNTDVMNPTAEESEEETESLVGDETPAKRAKIAKDEQELEGTASSKMLTDSPDHKSLQCQAHQDSLPTTAENQSKDCYMFQETKTESQSNCSNGSSEKQTFYDIGNQTSSSEGSGNQCISAETLPENLEKNQSVSDTLVSETVDQSSCLTRKWPTFDEDRIEIDESCETCQTLYKDPAPEDLVLYLHALKYKGPDWEFSTPLPDWAQDDWQEPAPKQDLEFLTLTGQ